MDKKEMKQYLGIMLVIIGIIWILYFYLKFMKPKAVESSNFSPAEYATYPRETGNPIADIALLNQAGYRYDH
jgi:hypothetical protein